VSPPVSVSASTPTSVPPPVFAGALALSVVAGVAAATAPTRRRVARATATGRLALVTIDRPDWRGLKRPDAEAGLCPLDAD
jgi:hypothetical protein